MAENKNTVLTVQVGGASVEIDSLVKARKAIKDLQSEVLKGNQEAIKSLADVKDRLEDVKEATNTVKGSGVEKLTSSFSLLSQGFTSFDTEKISTGFKGIGAAMGAIPIFLLIQGITLLIENFDKVIEFVSDFTTNTKELEAAANSAATAINSEADALKNLTDISEANLKTELLRLQSLKASTESLDSAKKQALENQLKYAKESEAVAVDEYNKLLQNDKATEEQIKSAGDKLTEIRSSISKAKRALIDFDYQYQIDKNKKADDLEKERLQKNKEYLDKLKQQKAQADKEVNSAFAQSLADEQGLIDASNKEIDDRQKQRDADKIAGAALVAQKEKEFRDQAVKDAEQNAANQIKIAEQIATAKINAEKNAFDGAKNLSDAFFQYQQNEAEGNTKRQNELAKRAFIVNKGLQLAQAGLEGYRSVVSTFAATPGGIVLKSLAAAAAGVAAAGMIAKIASVKYKGADAGGEGSAGQATVAPPPPPPQIASNNTTNSTVINNNGNNSGPIEAYVVETKLRTIQNRVKALTEQAQFG